MDNNPNSNRNPGEDLPGYPHYPADEDITNPGNGIRKANVDVEDLANSRRLSDRVAEPQEASAAADDEDDDLRIVPGTEADVTEEDLLLLGDLDADQDLNDDELTGNARVDRVGEEDEDEDLDTALAEQDDDSDAMGQGDEENDYYSLGGDRHESLDEDPAGGNQDQ